MYIFIYMSKLSITQVKETCLYVKDLQRTREFYEGKLGLPCFSLVDGRHAFFRAGRSVFLCFVSEATRNETNLPPHWGEGKLHFAFECPKEQYDDWIKKIEAEGIEILQHVDWPHGGRSFYFHDPDGHVAEIVEPGIWGD